MLKILGSIEKFKRNIQITDYNQAEKPLQLLIYRKK